jgi:hypothetical protein
LIDRIRHDIQERLEQLLAEVEKLRHALAALDPRGKPTSESTNKRAPRTAPTPKVVVESGSAQSAAASGKASSAAPAAPGATKAKVLGALSADGGMTAGDVAKATGLGRGSVSTTLSKLAKSGEVTKAERGYRLPAAAEPAVAEAVSTDG